MNSAVKQFIKWYVRYDLKLFIVSTSMVEGLKLKTNSQAILAVDSRFPLFWSKYGEKHCDGPYRVHRY